MTKEEHIKHWVNSAEEDLESAFAIFEAGRYNWSLFVGHLVIEKILKALFIQVDESNFPPRIHNLLKLAEYSGVRLTNEQEKFLTNVNKFQVEARYQEVKEELSRIATKDFTKVNLLKIKEHYLWLKSLIKY